MSATCHEEATVTGTAPGGKVQITVERSEACHSCSAKGACHALGGQTKDIVLVVDNDVSAAVGDRVRLTMSESAVVKASTVLYLLPALGLIGGATGGWAVAQRLSWQVDPAAILGALAGLVVGFLFSRLIGARMSRSNTFSPRLTAIIARESSRKS